MLQHSAQWLILTVRSCRSMPNSFPFSPVTIRVHRTPGFRTWRTSLTHGISAHSEAQEKLCATMLQKDDSGPIASL